MESTNVFKESSSQTVSVIDLLKSSDFVLTWSTETGLWIGRALEWTVFALLVHELTESPFQVSLVLVFYWGPMPVLSVLSGAISDRLERWRLLVIVHTGLLLITAVLLALILSGQIQPLHIFVGAILLGLCMALDWPTRNVFMCDMVGQKNINKAMSIDAVGLASGLLLGPIIGGFLVQTQGFAGPMIAMLVIYGVTLIMVSRIKYRMRPTRVNNESIIQSLRLGIQASFGNRIILGLLGCTIILDMLAYSAVGLFPVVGREHLNLSYGLTGLLASSQGIGMLIGTLIFIGTMSVLKVIRYEGRVFAAACAIWLAGVFVFALSPWYPFSFLCLLASGLAMGFYTPLQRTIILTVMDPEMHGRVIGVLGAAIGAVILGGLIVGAVAEALDPPWAIAINAGVGLLLLIPVLTLTSLVRLPIIRGSGEPGL